MLLVRIQLSQHKLSFNCTENMWETKLIGLFDFWKYLWILLEPQEVLSPTDEKLSERTGVGKQAKVGTQMALELH